MTEYYVLNDQHEPVAAASYLEWAKQFGAIENRRVAASDISDQVSVSTVFLGRNHQWGDGPPLLFETLVFGGDDDGWMDRYSTWAQAEAGHAEVVAKLAAGKRLEA